MHNIARDGRKSFLRGLGVVGLFLGNTAESDFYDLIIFVDLSNSDSTGFRGGNATRQRGSTLHRDRYRGIVTVLARYRALVKAASLIDKFA